MESGKQKFPPLITFLPDHFAISKYVFGDMFSLSIVVPPLPPHFILVYLLAIHLLLQNARTTTFVLSNDDSKEFSFLIFLCCLYCYYVCGGLEWGPGNEGKGKMVLSSAAAQHREMEGQNEEEQQNHQDHLPDLIELIFIKGYDANALPWFPFMAQRSLFCVLLLEVLACKSPLLVLTNCISSVGIWLVFGFVGSFYWFSVVLPDISTWVIWLCFSHYLSGLLCL
ncbi:hypothetical protein NC652_003924 [Populus alba x Populus x berolinensis]|nr:hypothetical protein NC652_003924 [Populus alba x Populus x berolinensis]